MSGNERIAGFWRWWAGRSDRIAAAIGAGTVPECSDEISAQVDALHQDLQWELAPGRRAQHALVVTAGGNPELRPLAERWFRTAPQGDPVWEYRPARAADPQALRHDLASGPHTLGLDQTELAIAIDEDRQLLDVSVHHPLFTDMPEEPRNRVSYLVLDWLLGEDGVERWVGAIESVVERPDDALPAEALPEIVDGLAERNPDGKWAMLEGRGEDGSVLLVTARRPLKWIDYPLFDQHIGVTLGYTEQHPAGLPSPEALTWLREAEDELTGILGDSAVLAAVATVNGQRTFHLYADSQDRTARDRASKWTEATHGARVEVYTDPGWRTVSRFA